jgi:uncharacterized protein YdaT
MKGILHLSDKLYNENFLERKQDVPFHTQKTKRIQMSNSTDTMDIFDDFDSIREETALTSAASTTEQIESSSSEEDNNNNLDYVDVDEIDDAIQDLNDIIEQTSDVHLKNELQEIYNVLYHAVYDSANIQPNVDPVPYALLVELQREMDKDVTPSSISSASSPSSNDMNRRSLKLDEEFIRGEVNKLRKSSSIGSMSPLLREIHQVHERKLSSSPSSPSTMHKRGLSGVVSHLKRLSISHHFNSMHDSQQQANSPVSPPMLVNNLFKQQANERIAVQAKQLKDVVTTEKKLNKEDEERLAKDLDLLLRQYIL